METMVDTPSRQSTALPSIAHLDSSKLHRDDEQSRRKGTALPSPSLYIFGREGQSHHGQNGGTGIITPPGSRRTSGEEETRPALAESKLSVQRAPQSLPSIHEALGRESALNYPGPPPPPSQSTIQTSTSSYFAHPSPTASTDGLKRDLAPNFPAPSHTQTTAAPPPPPPPPPPSTARQNSLPGSIFQSQPTRIPPLQPIRTGNSPPSTSNRPNLSYPPPQQAPGSLDQAPQSAPPNAPFGYSGYQSQYPYSSGTSASSSYHTPAVMSAPPQYPVWPVDPAGKRELKPKSYDQSIKRRIDDFDLESSLYELAKYGGQLWEYADSFAKRAKECKAVGDAPTRVVSLTDVEQLSEQIGSIQRAFARLQDAVHASHAELIEQQKELSRQYPSMRPEQNGYGQEVQSAAPSMTPDPNKRKRGGRAAPPGRCHSCNRAETPEWRRGPDGARTLCNACGLHYAKLTRKMGPNAKAAISSSNLRPKV